LNFLASCSISAQHLSNIPKEIINHFRRIKNIETLKLEVSVHVFDTVLDDRKVYLSESLKFIKRFQDSNAVVFLDPDTGLEAKRHGLQHVLESEAKIIYGIEGRS
jgi:hypothetical protein